MHDDKTTSEDWQKAAERNSNTATKLQAQLRETADVLMTVMRERDALREQVQRAETDLAALRAAVRAVRKAAAEVAVAIDGGTDMDLAQTWQKRIEADGALLALLPTEAT